MPPAVLADSDDDVDEIAAFECEDTVSSSRGNRARLAAGAKDGLDGADDRSTGSTERLRQIGSAERGLLSNSAPATNQQNSSASPARQAAKRRHSAAFASEGNASSQKGVRRTKTMKTYGASQRQLEPTDDGDFDHFRDDEDAAPPTFQSVRFSEHSGHRSSMPLPAGSLQTDFINHEPAVMFKDTGDTVADPLSEQQRLLDQAKANSKGLNTSVTKEIQPTLDQQSSSIPWTASDIAASAKSKKSEATANPENERGGEVGEREASLVDEATTAAEKSVVDDDQNRGPQVAGLHLDAKLDEFSLRRPKSSPMVEIPRQPSRQSVTDEDTSKPTQRASKGRKKKVEEVSSEPLDSDDRVIGLPKERYQPRPSRRRATQIVEEQISSSVVPERAAKVKRTKTTGANISVATKSNESSASPELKPGVGSAGLSKDGLFGDARRDPKLSSKPIPGTETGERDGSHIKRRRTIKQQDVDEPAEEQSKAKEQAKAKEESASPMKSLDDVRKDDDKIFVKPTVPTPKPKGSAKAKRAQTTIFEDHVEFLGSQRSPNLSQQQAKRKSALQDVQNEAASKPQRKRKSIVADDSDDEDELAKENDAVATKADPTPKNRTGRPPKADKQTQAKATDSVLKDSDEDGDKGHEDHTEAEESEDEEPPKKRGRGRPAKAASKTKAKDVPEFADDMEADRTRKDSSEKQDDTSQPDVQPASTPSTPGAAPAAEMPTPSPEKAGENTSATAQQAKSSAAQHSPIKSSSRVPLRVGLSKTRRIAPLLRIMRPPKK